MIALILDGKRAVLKKNVSFSLEIENREFEDRDAYSLSIDLPLRGCQQNMEIFGHALRAHIPIAKIRFRAQLILGEKVMLGAAAVVSMSESSVSVQFLEGRCAENSDDTLDKIYINDLDLGGYSDRTDRDSISPATAWGEPDRTGEFTCVALPWVSDYSGIMYNKVSLSGGVWSWVDPEGSEDVDDDTRSQDLLTIQEARKLTWQPSLIWISRKICLAVGLTLVDFDAWANSPKVRLMICNTLPPTYGKFDWADILPHWTVKEFFRNLEPLLQGYFDINLAAGSISFRAYGHASKKMTHIQAASLLEKASLDVSPDEKSAKYMSMKNIRYAKGDCKMWPLMDCEKAVRNWPQSRILSVTNLKSLAASYMSTSILSADSHRGVRTPMNSLVYVPSLDSLFALYALNRSKKIVSAANGWKLLTWVYDNCFFPVNRFGTLVRNDIEDGDDIELQFTPACVMLPAPDVPPTMYVRFSQMNDDEKWESQFYAEDEDDTELRQTSVVNILERDDKDKQVFFSTVSVAFYPGPDQEIYGSKIWPFPITDSIIPGTLSASNTTAYASTSRMSYRKHGIEGFSLHLKDLTAEQDTIHIDPRLKYKFRFIAKEIPDVRDIFVLMGRRYICEKLSVSFSFSGKSDIIEGDFYPVIEPGS